MRKYILILALSLSCVTVNAQESSSWSSWLGKASSVLNSLTGGDSVSSSDLIGTWTFQGCAVQLESDDVLKKAAGELAAGKAEEKLNEYCTKYGLTSSTGSFTFKEDGTFENVTPKSTLQGTYTLDGDTLTLKYSTSLLKSTKGISARVKKDGDGVNLLWNADKMMDVFSTLTSKTSNATLQSINSLIHGYDGLSVGIKIQKKK